MKCVSALVGLLCLMIVNICAQDSITVDFLEQIVAGDPWQLTIEASSGVQVIDVTLLMGVQRYQAALDVDASGRAIWLFEENILTHSGIAVLIITVDEQVYTRTLDILPDQLEQIDLFATGHAIAAYGTDDTQLISFLYDAYGNPLHNQVMTFRAQSPNGLLTQNTTFATQYGRSYAVIASLGNPGLMKITAEVVDISRSLQILQFPTEPASVNLSIHPPCLLRGRTESIQLEARVFDSNQFTVRDGTQVIFQWDEGIAFGTTINGIAGISLPSFAETGSYRFTAQADLVIDTGNFRLAETSCE